MLGVEFPICAFSHCRDVVAAVTNAGGFGFSALSRTARAARHRADLDRGADRGKPYGVDLLLPPKYVGADEGGIDPAGSGPAAREHRRSSTSC